MHIKIDKILNSTNDVFYEIIEKIESNYISDAQKELEKQQHLNTELIDAIEFSLSRLKSEENLLSQILYNSFGIGKTKNKRREQLIVLGSQLKGQITQFERDQKRVNFHYDNVVATLKNLTKLSKAFGRKMNFLANEELQKRAQSYLKELYLKMDVANACQKELSLKSIYLESCLFKYKEVLKKIPRHHEIKEENWNYTLTA
jgi:hypothetical protein